MLLVNRLAECAYFYLKFNSADISFAERITLKMIVVGIKWTAFNVTHWQFAFDYFSTAIRTSFICKGFEYPRCFNREDEKTNAFFLSLNIVLPTFYALSGYCDNYYGLGNTMWHSIYAISCVSVYFLQVITGIYLLYALLIIKKFLNAQVKEQYIEEVDVKVMVYHGVAFGCYSLSLLIAIVFVYMAEGMDI